MSEAQPTDEAVQKAMDEVAEIRFMDLAAATREDLTEVVRRILHAGLPGFDLQPDADVACRLKAAYPHVAELRYMDMDLAASQEIRDVVRAALQAAGACDDG